MPNDPAKRIANWDAGFDTTANKAKIDKKRADMLSRVQSQFVALTSMETQVKQTCDASGVPTIQYPFYLCFGREMWSLQNKEVSGESLAQEAAVLIAKWVARGLTQSVLQAIRTQVFNVGAPIAP
jgi:hypothetical protein